MLSNKAWHAILATGMLAMVAALGYQPSCAFAAVAHDSLSLRQSQASDRATAASIDVVKTTIARTNSRVRPSGDRITGTAALPIPAPEWRHVVLPANALLHAIDAPSGHSGRAPPSQQ